MPHVEIMVSFSLSSVTPPDLCPEVKLLLQSSPESAGFPSTEIVRLLLQISWGEGSWWEKPWGGRAWLAHQQACPG